MELFGKHVQTSVQTARTHVFCGMHHLTVQSLLNPKDKKNKESANRRMNEASIKAGI